MTNGNTLLMTMERLHCKLTMAHLYIVIYKYIYLKTCKLHGKGEGPKRVGRNIIGRNRVGWGEGKERRDVIWTLFGAWWSRSERVTATGRLWAALCDRPCCMYYDILSEVFSVDRHVLYRVNMHLPRKKYWRTVKYYRTNVKILRKVAEEGIRRA